MRYYESGVYPQGDNAVSVANALDCTLDWLLMGEGPEPDNPHKLKYESPLKSKKSKESIVVSQNSLKMLVNACQKLEGELSILSTNMTDGFQGLSEEIKRLSGRIEQLVEAMGNSGKLKS